MTEPSKINLNLDSLDREEVFEPFTFVLDGRTITMKDPKEIAWQDLATVEVPSQLARFCMSEEDRRFFLKARLPGWKFSELFKMYQEHFGLDLPGNAGASRI